MCTFLIIVILFSSFSTETDVFFFFFIITIYVILCIVQLYMSLWIGKITFLFALHIRRLSKLHVGVDVYFLTSHLNFICESVIFAIMYWIQNLENFITILLHIILVAAFIQDQLKMCIQCFCKICKSSPVLNRYMKVHEDDVTQFNPINLLYVTHDSSCANPLLG